MIKALFILIAASGAAFSQTDLHVGLLDRYQDGRHQVSFDSLLRVNNTALAGEFTTSHDWLVAGRGYFWHGGPAAHRYGLFFQPAVRRLDIAGSSHPWLFQSGLGIDGRVVGKLRLIGIISAAERLKTTQVGYTASFGGYYYLGHGLAVRAIFLRAHTAKTVTQSAIGVNYVFRVRP